MLGGGSLTTKGSGGTLRPPSDASLDVGERLEDVEEGWVDFVFVRELHVY